MKRPSFQFSPSFSSVVLIGTLWALLTVYLALAFGMPMPGDKVPRWYSIVSYILEEGAFLGAGWLCLRNWRLPQIISDRNVWLFLGLGTLLYLMATLIFMYWEIGLERAPNVSLADPFYMVSYLLLLWGMFLALKSRGLHLRAWQWVVLAAVAASAIGFGWQIATPYDDDSATLEQIFIASTATLNNSDWSILASVTGKEVPDWVLGIEKTLEPSIVILSWLYIVYDVLLLIMAATLLLNFWGGRFSRTWTLIASAALLLYIADMHFAYVATRTDYETNSIIDTFWTLSAIFFGVGAAWEYEISTRSRRRRS
ncbi:MAG: hypothetical protein IGR93_00940 [Hydrococcus sp. C42_A2020_068]|nr:hypothetical protein [Hydrococcus sp. C42_A2020_068]